MKLKIATWNLNTWINRKKKRHSNTQLWQWADDHLNADVVIFTEAETPPPKGVTAGRWSTAHRPFGFPGVSKWGTVIAARSSSEVRVEHITLVGTDNPYEVDTKFPGTLTAADLFIRDECIATLIGLHLRYRKDKSGKFLGHPEDDLDALRKDFEQIRDHRGKPLIIAGDFNFQMDEMPKVLKKLCRDDLALVDTFERQPQATFEQDWGERDWFRLDYMLLSKVLDSQVTSRQGGNPEFPDALNMSDHSPLLVEIDVSAFIQS
jgi:exonuclease III